MHINFVFRFDHSLVNPTFTHLDKDNNPLSIGPLNLTELFFNPLQYFISGRTDPVLHGLLQDKSREVDEFVTRVLTTQLFANSEDSLGQDLAAQNIQIVSHHINIIRSFVQVYLVFRLNLQVWI